MKVAHGAPLELSATVIAKIRESHARAQTFVDSPDARVYGLTTGVAFPSMNNRGRVPRFSLCGGGLRDRGHANAGIPNNPP